MASSVDLSIIIVSYNTSELLKVCLESIKDSKTAKYTLEIIVIDNNSTDGSYDMVKKIFPRVILIQNKENLGFARANNEGILKARGRYVLFLNPDTIVYPNVLKFMIEFMDLHPEMGVAGPRVELASGELDEGSHRGFPTPWNALAHFSGLGKLFPRSRLFAGYTLGWELGNPKPHEVDSVVGAFYMVRREAGDEVNWWDEDYFWYGDELDFSYRLKKAGWKVMYIPQVKILHYKGASSGIGKSDKEITTATRQTRVQAARASTEAMRIFYKKHYFNKYPQFLTWLVLTGISILQMFRVIKYSF